MSAPNADYVAECRWLPAALNWKGLDRRTDAAAHRLHETHVAWARTAISTDPRQCYQCHTFARIVAESLAAPIDGSASA